MTIQALAVRRFKRKPRNGCSSCLEDFASIRAFDRHRTGAFNGEGEKARRCMDETEMLAAGLDHDRNGRWCVTADVEAVRRQFGQAAWPPSKRCP
jgi:hypothetical protein